MRIETARIYGFAAIALVAVGCGGKGEEPSGDAAVKAGLQQAATLLKEPIALVSAYRPYVAPYAPDKYAPKNHPVYDRSAAAAANEIRHAANGARQKMPSAAGPIGSDLEKALLAVATSCADAADDAAFAKCNATVTALDEALGKASTAGGVPFTRVAPTSITEAAKKATAKLEKAVGPLTAEKAYFAKRADAAAKPAEVVAACQAAAQEVDGVSNEFERAEEPIRVTAASHKMNIDAQCKRLDAVDELAKGVAGCKKTPKKPECLVSCGKAKAQIDEGLPAAAFSPMEHDVAEACK